MPIRPLLRALCALSVTAVLASAALAAPPERSSVLVLTGENETDWRWTSTWIHRVLHGSGKFDVEVTLYPAGALADGYDIERFDAFVLDYAGAPWGEPAESNLLEAVRGGKGLVVLGPAAKAFPGWAEFGDLVGIDWAEEAEPVRSPSRFAVTPTEEAHVLRTRFGEWKDHLDLLQTGARGVRSDSHRVLAVADGGRMPLIVSGDVGEGRVLTTTLGHVPYGNEAGRESQTDVQFQQLLIRAVEWAATGELTGLARDEPNTLTDAQRAEGWRLLFDGTSTSGWSSYQGEGLPEDRWAVEGGALVIRPSSRPDDPLGTGDILAAERFDEFELQLEWRLTAGAEGLESGPGVSVWAGEERSLGPDEEGVDAAAARRVLRPPGEWNHVRIKALQGLVQEWTNGVKVMTLYTDPADFARRLTGDNPGQDPELSQLPLFRIGLQPGGAAVSFRNIMIRQVEPPPPAVDPSSTVDLFAGDSLAGWRWTPIVNENAPNAYTPQPGGLVTSGGNELGYLMHDLEFTSFLLEVDYRYPEANPMKSGVAGLILRATPARELWPRGVEVRVQRKNVGDLRTFWSFPVEAEPRRSHPPFVNALRRDMERRDGQQWNHLEVRLVGGELTVRLNGEVVNAARVLEQEPGSIALRTEGGIVQWRNLRVTPLQ
jgi:hypothetical protein